MKVLFSFLPFLVFSLGIYQNGFSQFGDKSIGQYIVHDNGDTLFGKLTLEQFHIKISYTKDKEVVRKFPYGDIKTYKTKAGNVIYKRLPLFPKGREFEILSHGKIIYYYNKVEGWFSGAGGVNGAPPIPYYRTAELYYVEKGKELFRLKPASYKKQLKKLLKGDDISLKRLKNKSIEWEHITDLIKDYNERNSS